MSRKLNLHLPTSKEFLVHAPQFGVKPTITSRPQRSSSLAGMKEKLDKTSELWKKLEEKETIVKPAEEDLSKEIQALKTKIAQLEREK